MYISVSGSTILSDTNRLAELFTPYHDGIEIGFLEDETAWQNVIKLIQHHKMETWGVHFPRLRMAQHIANNLAAPSPSLRIQTARALLDDARITADHGGNYILAHFPFFRSSTLPTHAVRERILHGIQLLRRVAARSPVPVVIECKLGLHRDPGGIRYVVEWGESFFQQLTGIDLCLDVGDWSIAALSVPEAKRVFEKLLPQATHLHLHGVALKDDSRYYWTPVEAGAALPVKEWRLSDIIAQFHARRGEWIVCEHTPHEVQNAEQVMEGYKWLRQVIRNVM